MASLAKSPTAASFIPRQKIFFWNAAWNKTGVARLVNDRSRKVQTQKGLEYYEIFAYTHFRYSCADKFHSGFWGEFAVQGRQNARAMPATGHEFSSKYRRAALRQADEKRKENEEEERRA